MFESRRQTAKFELGQIVATPGALTTLGEHGIDPMSLVLRHVEGDFGDLDAEDAQSNEFALISEARIFSAYNLPKGDRVWVITEWDRSYTTMLLPEEY